MLLTIKISNPIIVSNRVVKNMQRKERLFMLLEQVLKTVKYSGDIPLDIDIKDIAYNSNKAGEDILFVCLVGAVVDGHDFAFSAYEKGCRFFVCQHDVLLPDDANIILVDNTREALAILSANFFGHPSNELAVIGITGTKGKTTTTHIIKDVLEKCGIKTGLIGTVGASYGNTLKQTVNTTPESYETQKLLREMADNGCTAVAMEVSSLGVKMHRVDNLNFKIGVFTNISPDHIGGDEHKTFEEYYGWKKAFFDMCDIAIGCADDEATQDMIKNATEKTLFGIECDANYIASNVKPFKNHSFLGTVFDLSANGKIYENMQVSLPGYYSVYNALAAIAVCEKMGINIDDMREPLSRIHISGRTEPVLISDDYSIIIDYAHNGTSLRQLLQTMRAYEPNRLICLFGSVGDRAQLRRKEMGLVAGSMCDLSIITSDDPNFEDPEKIIEEIASYVEQTGGKYEAIVDREKAIDYAVQVLQEGDMLILAGKGHEKFQKVKGELVPIDERKCVSKALESLNII